ncbi:15551_t:CDS:2, partial [Racocetra fulgida]
MAPHKPFSCQLCNNSYSSKLSLSRHENTKHNMNRIVPHHQHLPVISEGIINHFRAVLLQDINSKLGFHRTNEGLKHIQWSFPERQNGYNRIGTILGCQCWGKRKNEIGCETYVVVEEKDNNGSLIEKNIEFIWREKTVTKQ